VRIKTRAVVRSALWDPAHQSDPATLSTPGAILPAMSGDRVGSPDYDRVWPERARTSYW